MICKSWTLLDDGACAFSRARASTSHALGACAFLAKTRSSVIAEAPALAKRPQTSSSTYLQSATGQNQLSACEPAHGEPVRSCRTRIGSSGQMPDGACSKGYHNLYRAYWYRTLAPYKSSTSLLYSTPTHRNQASAFASRDANDANRHPPARHNTTPRSTTTPSRRHNNDNSDTRRTTHRRLTENKLSFCVFWVACATKKEGAHNFAFYSSSLRCR